MAITFGGLATGMDTGSIISALMDIEREPLKRLETEKEYLATRLEAFSQFQDKLSTLRTAVEDMDGPDELGSYSATAGSDEHFGLSILDPQEASSGNFQVEVVNLAQVQKNVSEGVSERDTAVVNRAGTMTIAGTSIAIAINSSLNDMRDAINVANSTDETGVSASIIYDGTDYRLVLTGDTADTNFSVDINRLRVEGSRFNVSNTQAAESAEIIVDGITITSNSNSIDNAIPGVTIDLLRENTSGESTTVNVATDFTEVTTKLEAFVSAYNEITNFINAQKDSDWGHDNSLRTVQRTMRSLLTATVDGAGNFSHLVDLGFKTDAQTGLLSLNATTLDNALNEDYGSVEQLMLGDDSNSGILEQFTTYLDSWTDTLNGLYAGKKQSHDSSVRSLDSSIERMERRLEQREAILTAQFAAMEELVSGMNATSSYLTQQMTMLSSLAPRGGNNG